MVKRNMITIDEEKCTGCGQCVDACMEGALSLVDGKAKLVREDYCDGLGACVGECPAGALKVIEKECSPSSHSSASKGAESEPASGGCTGAMMLQLQPNAPASTSEGETSSALGHWPIQLHLIRPDAPHYRGAEILIAATCSAFACGNFHSNLLSGKSLIIACPKLDNPAGYREKLAALFQVARPKRVTVARMVVPCCRGLVQLIVEAREAAQAQTPVQEIVLGLQGEIQSETEWESVAV